MFDVKKLFKLICYCTILGLLSVSCIKDTNFDQAEDVTLSPIVESNFIYLNLEGRSFFDSINNIQRLTVRDTTEIRFLDDSGFKEGLKKVDFLFKYTNSIPRQINVTYRFLSASSDTTYTIQNVVAPGSLQNVSMSENIENIEGNDLVNLTRANKVVVVISIPSADKNLPGNFNLQSKGTFYFEF